MPTLHDYTHNTPSLKPKLVKQTLKLFRIVRLIYERKKQHR